MKDLIGYIIAIILVCALIYGMYYVAKSVSYFFFYEGFVQDTIREMVKAGALK